MHKGIYIALSGAILKQKHMDLLAQNIANSNTSGYKKERISFKDYLIPRDSQSRNIPDGRTLTELSNIATDFSGGTLIRTGNDLDVAINGDGFFSLEGNRYTRNGNFRKDAEGYIVTSDGIKVLGSGGPVNVQGGKIEISASGEIFVDGISAGNLSIVDFDDRGVLEKMDGGVYYTRVPGKEIEANVSQGYLEASNVEVVEEMVKMINALREFESYQKMIRAFDEAAAKTTDEMAR